MKVYVDTNILVAAAAEGHPHHLQSSELISQVHNGNFQGFISTHGLAEFYAVLTRTPFTPRMYPADAGRFLDDDVLPHFQLVALTADDYRVILSRCATAGIAGGRIFDALHLHSAAIAGCDRIYTFNVRHFRLLAPEELKHKIVMP